MNFTSNENSILKEKLDQLDVLKITPMEAINILYELKEISKK